MSQNELNLIHELFLAAAAACLFDRYNVNYFEKGGARRKAESHVYIRSSDRRISFSPFSKQKGKSLPVWQQRLLAGLFGHFFPFPLHHLFVSPPTSAWLICSLALERHFAQQLLEELDLPRPLLLQLRLPFWLQRRLPMDPLLLQ